MAQAFPHLFSEQTIGQIVVPNRLVFTGHHTYLSDGAPDERLIAYHQARADGGAGLIVTEIVAVHESAGFSPMLLDAFDRESIPAYRRLAKVCHEHGSKIFAQLFHPGREILSAANGMLPVAWAPSAVPNERFHILPKAMPADLIREIIAGFGMTAALLAEAGFDGFEIVASHGYLPAQFLNPRVNLRDDAYGGNFDRRLRFLLDCIDAIRAAAGDRAVGLRLSGSEMDSDGLTGQETIAICQAVDHWVDYLSVVAGTSASLGGSVHIVPPMGLESAYLAPLGAAIKDHCEKPVIVTGRINQPQVAEGMIAADQADLCGMTRAMICDPQMPAKARRGHLENIRACIGCNQACIGRAHKGLGISCIQHPESGRELDYGALSNTSDAKKVMVVGGGPAGMKAAAIAAARGHTVSLYEREGQLGGQARLAQCLPGREEFGGIITNLEREMEQTGVAIYTSTRADRPLIESERPDVVLLATGATPRVPALEGLEEAHVVTAWEVLRDRVNIGASVVIADWRADWIGLGLAERLTKSGCAVTLCVNAAMAGESLQLYTRNHYVGRLHKLGVTIKTHARLFGTDGETVYFQDTLCEEPIVLEGINSLVLSLGHESDAALEGDLEGIDADVLAIGDCVVPRTAEEAVFEGLKAGWHL
ncbi:MAG: FAD-dependent oxidoreductase [Pseudomonadota bacterium]